MGKFIERKEMFEHCEMLKAMIHLAQNLNAQGSVACGLSPTRPASIQIAISAGGGSPEIDDMPTVDLLSVYLVDCSSTFTI